MAPEPGCGHSCASLEFEKCLFAMCRRRPGMTTSRSRFQPATHSHCRAQRIGPDDITTQHQGIIRSRTGWCGSKRRCKGARSSSSAEKSLGVGCRTCLFRGTAAERRTSLRKARRKLEGWPAERTARCRRVYRTSPRGFDKMLERKNASNLAGGQEAAPADAAHSSPTRPADMDEATRCARP